MASLTLDELDHKIIHALQLDGRASFARLAEVLGVSEQTVARRYRRLRQSDVVRVVGQLDSERLGQSDWAIRIRCTPDAAVPLCTALAQRPDTAWVQVTSGGTEVFATVRSHGDRQRTALLLEQLPANRRIVSLEAYCLLRLFTSGWARVLRPGGLTAEQAARLRPSGPDQGGQSGPGQSGSGQSGSAQPGSAQPGSAQPGSAQPGTGMIDADWPLVWALAEDGRATYRQLAARTHWHESTVRRRVEELTASGVLYFDLDVSTEALGAGGRAILWMSVAPAHLLAAGRALATYPEVPFAAATTGSTNLVASLACRDEYAMFEFLTREIAALDGLTHLETSPILRTVKMHGTVAPVG